MPPTHLHHLGEATGLTAADEVIGEHDRKRLVPYRRFRAPNRMAQSQRFGLTNEHAGHVVGQNRTHLIKQSILAPRSELGLKLVGLVEVIDDRVLGTAGHEYELGDPGSHRLFRCVLDEGLVDDWQHFLGARFRRRQEPGTEPGNREHRLAYPRRHDGRLNWGRVSRVDTTWHPPPSSPEVDGLMLLASERRAALDCDRDFLARTTWLHRMNWPAQEIERQHVPATRH